MNTKHNRCVKKGDWGWTTKSSPHSWLGEAQRERACKIIGGWSCLMLLVNGAYNNPVADKAPMSPQTAFLMLSAWWLSPYWYGKLFDPWLGAITCFAWSPPLGGSWPGSRIRDWSTPFWSSGHWSSHLTLLRFLILLYFIGEPPFLSPCNGLSTL